MPQTVLAFLAMMIVTMLSLNQQQSMLLAYELMLNDEMEFMASAVALRSIEYISQRDFDNAVAGGATVANPSELQDLPFVQNNFCRLQGALFSNPCIDIDDFHGMTVDTVAFSARADSFAFAIRAEVQYVDDAINPDSSVTYETYAKLISVEAQDVMGIMLQPIRITRLVVCEPADGCL